MTATRRLQSCVERWPECETGEYNPSCCHFPKSCSATVYNPETIPDDALEPAVEPAVARPTELTPAEVVDIANRAQEETGRSVWPSTVRAVLAAWREVRP